MTMTPADELRQIKAEQIRMKREAATRARRLAVSFWSPEDRDRALRFAQELEAQADGLAREAAVPGRPQTTQMQMQVQQGPPSNDKDEPEK
jgi:alkanesulfonate monooxygenase SsuD/methylene tetrahydromethanopterin reductase-like flavin-dependent oxidoreductase (luciferase family)